MSANRKLNFGNKYEYCYSNDKYKVQITSRHKTLDRQQAADKVEQALKDFGSGSKRLDCFMCTFARAKFDVGITVKGSDRFINAADVLEQFKTMILDEVYEDENAVEVVDEVVDENVKEDLLRVKWHLEEVEEITGNVDNNLDDIKAILKHVDNNLKGFCDKGDDLDENLVLKMKSIKNKLNQVQKKLQENLEFIDKSLDDTLDLKLIK